MKTFYSLTDNPFVLTPDAKFFYWSPTHRETFQLLVRSQQGSRGIPVVTGTRGTGKTALLQAFAAIQEPRTRIVFLPHAVSSVPDLFVLLAPQLGLASDTPQSSDQHSDIHAWLRTCVQRRETILLLLDNAHEWPEHLLADLDMLASLGTATYKLFHIVLAGPPSLLDHLRAPRLAALRARIEGIGQLAPLELADTQAYIRHGLTVAGRPAGTLFDSAAVEVIYRYSQGIPRAISQICSQALEAGFAAQMPRINVEIVRHVVTRMGLHEPAPAHPVHARTRHTRRGAVTAIQQPTYPRATWPGMAGQDRGRLERCRPARRTRTLLALGAMLLIAAGGALVLGGGLREHRTPLLALASLAVGRSVPVTPEPPRTSDDALAVTAESAVSGARETPDQREHLSSESAPPASSPPEASPATVRTRRLVATPAPPRLSSPGDASTTPRETRQRPPQSLDTLRLAKTPRVQPHEPTQPLAYHGPALPPVLPRRSEPVAPDTLAAAERPALSPQGQAQLSQDVPSPGVAPPTGGTTATRFSGPATNAPEPPPREAVRSAQQAPAAAWEMAQPVPARPVQGRTVEIHTAQAQASVVINGRYVGQTPVVVHLPLGVYTMAIGHPGYAQMTWKMHVDPDGVALHMARSRGWSWPLHYMPRILAH